MGCSKWNRSRRLRHPRSRGRRRELLEGCKLHTGLDCPAKTVLGAGVKTVVLFFEKGAPTRRVWYYQLDPGRSLGKTDPLNDDDLAEFVELQAGFVTGPKSWIVEADGIDRESWALSGKNPNRAEAARLRDPGRITAAYAAWAGEGLEVPNGIGGWLRWWWGRYAEGWRTGVSSWWRMTGQWWPVSPRWVGG